MSLFLIIVSSIGAHPASQATVNTTNVAAVLVEKQGTVYLSRQGKRVTVRAGQGMRAGDLLRVPEDSNALLVYTSGRYTRLQGPARTTIAAGSATSSNRKTSQALGSRFAGLFAGREVGELATTVGGVRKPLPLVLLSPRQNGFTPRKFRVSWSMRGQPSGFGLADHVSIRVLKGQDAVITRTFDPLDFRRDSRPFNFELPASDKQSEKYRLEIKFFAEDDFGEDVLLGGTRTILFTVAPPQTELVLREELQKWEEEFGQDARRECRSRTMLAIARAETFLTHGFRGEAVAEITSQLNTDPDNALWQRMLEHCLSVTPTHPVATISAK